MKTKICSYCKYNKYVDSFYKDKNGKHGVRSICKKCDIERRDHFRKRNIEAHRKYRKKYYEQNKSEILKRQRDYMANGVGAKYSKKHRERLGNKYNKKRSQYDKKKRELDNIYKLKRATSNIISCAIRRSGYRKKSKTADILGCNWQTFKKHLEAQFKPGMSWNNYGEWHIDHITPCCSAQNKYDLFELQHFTNLRPLWASDNLKKGGKY